MLWRAFELLNYYEHQGGEDKSRQGWDVYYAPILGSSYLPPA